MLLTIWYIYLIGIPIAFVLSIVLYKNRKHLKIIHFNTIDDPEDNVLFLELYTLAWPVLYMCTAILQIRNKAKSAKRAKHDS